jgi:hypothetical protein
MTTSLPTASQPSRNVVAPSVEQIQRIAALADPVLRNLQITQAYSELAQAMAALTGAQANWCTFATWASKQAGQSIRQEDLQRAFERLLAGSPEVDEALAAAARTGAQISGNDSRSLAGAIAALRDALSPKAAFGRVSDAVARGNQKVFAEIGYEFARFLALFADRAGDEQALAAFREGLRPGDPPEGQRYLRHAFTCYYLALDEKNPKAQAEWMFLANIEIGLHEQTRLQPEIVEALNAAIYDPAELRRRLAAELFPNPGAQLRFALARLAGRAQPLLRARDALAEQARRLARLAITDKMMTLTLPGDRTLRLGQDLRAPFPPTLRQIANPEAQALLQHVDPTPDSMAGGGAADWGHLPDRLHFIVDLFRAYHEERTLFSPPFDPAQTASIAAGRVPAGRL